MTIKTEETELTAQYLERLARAFNRPTSSATVTFTGSGIASVVVAMIAVVCTIYAAGEVRIAEAKREADAKEIASLRDEIHKVSTEQQTDRIWLQKHENRLGKEK